MSYKGAGAMTENSSLWVDKNMVVHYDGNPKFAEEYNERVLLGFQSLSTNEKASYAAKLKNALSGRAWTLVHKRPEISAEKLISLAASEPTGTTGPQAAVSLLVKTVRQSCERVAPLLKNQVFEEYFFTKGMRRASEPIQDYIQRRQNEYERLQSLTQGHTKLSVDLQTFFLLRNSGCSAQQQKAILGQAGNEYDWDRVVEAMLIQLDQDDTSRGYGISWKGSHKGKGNVSYASGSRGSWSFPAEEEEWYDGHDGESPSFAYEAEADDESQWYDAWPSSPEHQDDDGGDHIYDDMEELEHSFDVLTFDEMSQGEIDAFAFEAQRMAKNASEYMKKRKMVRDGKSNRGFNQGLQHNRTSISIDGKLSLNGEQLGSKLASIKSKSRCFACNGMGHWEGDKQCPKLGMSKGGKGGKSKKGRKGGFLQRAGVAAAMIASAAGSCILPSTTETEVMMLEPAFSTEVTIPWSVQVLSASDGQQNRAPPVPLGFAVIDTAALLGCGGDQAVDAFIKKFKVEDCRSPLIKVFKGVNSGAPITSVEEQWLSIGLASRDAHVSIHRLPNSTVPILFGLPQLKALGAKISLDGSEPYVIFQKVSNRKIPLQYGRAGHLLLNIADWNPVCEAKATVSTKEIEVFAMQEKSQKTNKEGGQQRILHRKERMKIQRWIDEAKKEGEAIWKELRKGQRSSQLRLVKELYCGADGGAVSKEARLQDVAIGKPYDLLLGDDLLDSKQQRKVLEDIREEQPFLVIIAFPCTAWSSLSNFKLLGKRLEEQALAWRHLAFVKRVCTLQAEAGRHYLLENPASSQAWKHMPWLQYLPHTTVTMHQCQTNLKDEKGNFIMKPTRFVTSAPHLAEHLILKCPYDHQHGQVQGRGQGISQSLATWTPELAQRILEGVSRQLKHENEGGDPFHYDQFHLHEEVETFAVDGLRRSANVVMKEMEGEDFQQWEEVPMILRSAIVKIHQQYSHSLIGEDLARHLRLGGASEKAIKAARLMKCQRCEAEKRSVPRPVAAVPKYEHFNQCVAMDIAFLPCLQDVQHAFLVMVDQATHYMVAAYIMSAEAPGRPIKPDALSVKNAFVNWVEMFGKPDRVQIDQDSAFRKGFKQVLDLFLIDDVMVPRDAHWSHGIVERRILTLKEMIVKVVPDFLARGHIMMRVVVSQCTHTLNRLCNNRGFSPAQCVLGANPKLPEVLAGNTLEDLPNVDERPLAMAQRLDLIRMCEESFVKANHSASLKRAILAQVRRQPGPFEQHSLVMYRRREPLKHLLHRQWHGPARVIGKDEMGYWLIHRGFPVLAHPNNMRKMVADEVAQLGEPSLSGGPKGQRGYIDASKPIEEEPHEVSQREPREISQHELDEFEKELDMGPTAKKARVEGDENQEAEYFPESPHEGEEEMPGGGLVPFSSRMALDGEDLPPPEPEEDDGRGYSREPHDLDDEESEAQQRFHKVKSTISKSARRRLRRRRLKVPPQPVVVEQDQEEYQRNVISDFQAQSSEERKKRVLDDIPVSVRRGVEDSAAPTLPLPCVEEGGVENEKEKEGSHKGDREEHRDKRARHGPYYVYSFLSERCDEYVKKNKHTELHPHKILSQLPQWEEKMIYDAMQKAANKEIDTWLDFDAVDIISPKESAVIMKENPEKVIDSRAVWTEKESVNEELVLKCRIVGKGFQEMYDDKLRRDSPTCSQLLVNLVCSLASSKKMKLKAGDVKGAFLQGVKIDRELYFRMPRNMGNVKLKHTEPGSLFRLKKAIYGVNDAARKWYMSLRTILIEIGWKPLTFENAGFILRDEGSKAIIAIMALHVDDILLAMDEENFPKECEKVQKLLQSKIQWGSWRDCMDERVKFCGRHYHQGGDFSIEIDSDDYIESMSTYKMSREKMKSPEVVLEPHELRAFRGLLGQLQWYARIAGYDVGFSISQLAGRLKEPKIKDLAEASRMIKQIKSGHLGRKIFFSSKVKYDPGDVSVIAVHDASFNNVANHGSQRGCWIGVTNKKMIDEHGSTHGVHFLQWSTGRIQRVVRSTLSAEAYSCSEAIDQLNWLRGTIAEVLKPTENIREYSMSLSNIPGVVVTDCKSLYDCLHGERTLLSDKRLSLEAAIIRQGLQENVTVKWVCSEQQLADCLTKQLNGRSLEYIQQVMAENSYTLGPDSRTGKTRREEARKRKEMNKEMNKVNDEQQAMELNKKPVKRSSSNDGLCNNLLLTMIASNISIGQGARLNVDMTIEVEAMQVLYSVLDWVYNISCHWFTITILSFLVVSIVLRQVWRHWEDLSIELHTLNRVNQWGVVAVFTWLITTVIQYGMMSEFSPNSKFYWPHFVCQLTLTMTVAWYFKQWFLAKFKFTWKNADLKQRQQREMMSSVKGELVEHLRSMETRMIERQQQEMQLRQDMLLNYIGAFQNTMVFRSTVISQELAAQYATSTRTMRRIEEKVEAVDARIKLIHDVVLEMLQFPEDETKASLFRQIDERLERRLRRIDMVGTPTVSGDEHPTTSEEDENNNEEPEDEEEQRQPSEESEENNRLIQRYRQAIEDGNQQLADGIEREIFERWIGQF